jgi:copper homeostasis protein
MSGIEFEVCAEGLAACDAAREGGAQRIELCCALSEGGLTPSHALLRAAVERSGLPVYVLLRPRGGDFVYSEDEWTLVEADLLHAKELGATGFVAGALDAAGRVDGSRMRRLVELAEGREVTFHRAFDAVADQARALEDVIAAGCARVLTSGGAPDVLAGVEQLRRLGEQAAERIVVMAGGGLRLESAAEVARISGLRRFHGSLRGQRLDAAAVRGMLATLAAGAADSLRE